MKYAGEGEELLTAADAIGDGLRTTGESPAAVVTAWTVNEKDVLPEQARIPVRKVTAVELLLEESAFKERDSRLLMAVLRYARNSSCVRDAVFDVSPSDKMRALISSVDALSWT